MSRLVLSSPGPLSTSYFRRTRPGVFHRELTMSSALLAILLCFIALVYWKTLRTTLQWGDGADLASACLTLGIAHPPGYSLLVITGYLWLKASAIIAPRLSADPVVMLNSLNALIAIAGLLLVGLLAASEGKGRPITASGAIGATFAVGILGFARPYWDQAISLEVYALEASLVVALLWVLTRTTGRSTILPAALLAGLLLSHHPGNIIYLIVVAPLLVADSRGLAGSHRFWMSALSLLCVGMLPLVFPVLRTWLSVPAISWGDLTHLKGYLGFITVSEYQWAAFGVTQAAPLDQLAAASGSVLQSLISVLPAILVGIYLCWKYQVRTFYVLSVVTLVTILATAINQTEEKQAFLLPAYACLAAFAGFGLKMFLSMEQRGYTSKLLGAMVASILLGLHLGRNYPREGGSLLSAATYTDALLRQAREIAPNSVLVTSDSSKLFVYRYMCETSQQLHPQVVMAPFLAFPWYVKSLHMKGIAIPFSQIPGLLTTATGTQEWTNILLEAIIRANPDRSFLLDEGALSSYHAAVSRPMLLFIPHGLLFRTYVSGPDTPDPDARPSIARLDLKKWDRGSRARYLKFLLAVAGVMERLGHHENEHVVLSMLLTLPTEGVELFGPEGASINEGMLRRIVRERIAKINGVPGA